MHARAIQLSAQTSSLRLVYVLCDLNVPTCARSDSTTSVMDVRRVPLQMEHRDAHRGLQVHTAALDRAPKRAHNLKLMDSLELGAPSLSKLEDCKAGRPEESVGEPLQLAVR